MPKNPNAQDAMSAEEWANLPITFGCDVMARLLGSNLRYTQNHAQELGATKLAGRWLFSKPRVAEMLGIEGA